MKKEKKFTKRFADPEAPRPQSVDIAVQLLGLSFVMGVLRALLEFRPAVEAAAEVGGFVFVLTIQALVLGFLFLNIYFIRQRKNWARWIFVILLVTGLPFAVEPTLTLLSENLYSGIVSFMQALLQVVAAVFLFRKPSRAWFKKLKVASS